MRKGRGSTGGGVGIHTAQLMLTSTANGITLGPQPNI